MKFSITYHTRNQLVATSGSFFVPRIGEHIRIGGHKYKVIDVIYETKQGETFGEEVEILLEY